MATIKELEIIFEVTPDEQAILLISDLGMGKSEYITSYWESKGYKVICVHGAEMCDAGDVCGLPDREIINGEKRTVFAPPYWFPFEKSDERICIFCDEINRAKPEILAAFHDMILTRTLNGRKLSSHTRIIGAINPNTEDGIDYDVNDLDPAFIDRFNIIPFQPSYEEWISWAIKNKINKYVIGFLSKNSANYLDPPKKMKTGEKYTSRRSWVRLSNILNVHPEILEDPDYKLKLIASPIVGIGATSKFAMYVKENMKGLNVGLIVSNWNKELEKQIKLTMNNELVNINDELAAYLEQNYKDLFGNKTMSSKYAYNVYCYLRTVPKEIIAHFFGLVNQATNNGKTWQNDLLANSDELVKYFMDVVNGADEHDKEIEKMLAGDGDDGSEDWKKK